MIRKFSLLTLSLYLLYATSSYAQKDWHLQAPILNKTYGTDVVGASQLLKNKQPQKVIVAVLDTGTDIDHEGLTDLIWTNDKEIVGNNIDDDKNGYIDDIHGWSFMGGTTHSMGHVALQSTRNYQMLHRKYKDVDSTTISNKDTAEYSKYLKDRKRYLRLQGYRKRNYESAKKAVEVYDQKLWAKFANWAIWGFKAREMNEYDAAFSKQEWLVNALNADSFRIAVVGDDPNDPHERYYGNNDVIGPDPEHGTHTAGLIASVAKADGRDWLHIIPLRVVPTYGDEYDKDVANGIRYAVDHGAKVISMSFGKYSSPFVAVVDSAIQYALAHDVLLVHGAGNDARKLDSAYSANHPNPYIDSNTIAPNWLEVGASAKSAKKPVASFSNYGKESVHVFAPGKKVYATLPNDKYDYMSGTSMAAPVVAGIAAMLRSYFPDKSAVKIKDAIMKTVTPYSGSFEFGYSKNKKVMTLEDMCISGGVINAAKAVQYLQEH